MITDEFLKSKCVTEGFDGCLDSGWFSLKPEIYYSVKNGVVKCYRVIHSEKPFTLGKSTDFTDEAELDKFIESCK